MSSPLPVSLSVPEWNFTLQSSVQLVIDDSNLKATEAVLYIKKSDFMSMFVTTDLDSLDFAEGADAVIKTALKNQSVYFNLAGNTASTNMPSLTDSFLVESANSVTGTTLNLAEQNLLKNSLEAFGFHNAFIAYSNDSRNSSLTESIGMGQKCVEHILGSVNQTLAKRIFSDLSNERVVTNLSEAFIVGDQLTFLVNFKPDSANANFVEQNYKCVIELVDAEEDPVSAGPYSVVSGNLRVFTDTDYNDAYTNASTDFTYTDSGESAIGTLVTSTPAQI
jgi:hypothetical protein